MALDSFVGLLPDINSPGGSTFDQLATTWATTPPAPTIFFPLTEANAEKTVDERINRNDEMRGEPDDMPDVEFREAYSPVLSGKLYPYVLKRLMPLLTGAVDAKTGTAPAAITHKFTPIGYTAAFGLPACHIVIGRDDLAEAFGGCQLDTLQLNFPLEGDATFTATFRALFRVPLAAYVPPTEVFTNVELRPLMLRDADAFLDGSGTAVDAFRGVELTMNNMFQAPEFWPKRNRDIVIDSTEKHMLWHPNRYKRGRRRACTGRIMFSDIKTVQQRRRDIAHGQKLVLEVEGRSLGTTPAANELARFTGQKMVYTGGGPNSLTRETDLTSDYEFQIARDPGAPSVANAWFWEFLDNNNTAITFAP